MTLTYHDAQRALSALVHLVHEELNLELEFATPSEELVIEVVRRCEFTTAQAVEFSFTLHRLEHIHGWTRTRFANVTPAELAHAME